MSNSSSARATSAEQPSRRTNSLGFAKIDCHTCSELGDICDRKRPRCGSCSANRRKCGGFAMNLMWKDPIVSRKTSKVTQPRRQPGTCNGHSFKFVRGRLSRKRQPKLSKRDPKQFDERLKSSEFYSTWQLDEVDQVDEIGEVISPSVDSHTLRNGNNELEMFVGSPITLDNLLPSTPSSGSPPASASITQLTGCELGLSIPPIVDFLFNIEMSDCNTPIQPISHAITQGTCEGDGGDDEQETLVFEDSFPLQVTYQNLAHKYHSVLDLYNEKFCVVPLSHDCRNNPFRIRMDFTESFTFLLHAVLAISSHHLAKTNNCSNLDEEMQKHWCTAIRLFSTALGHCNFQPLLDTLLILINIESTQSAYGMSDMHLRGAHRLLRESSAAEECKKSPRLRAQMAMLIWWDVTASLISRREPRLPLPYLETLAQYDDGDGDGWSFFTLTGCPVHLVQAMWRLAGLAHIYERTVNMEWTIFNRLPVDSIMEEVRNFVNYDDFSFHDVGNTSLADVNARRNRFHCIEAWRHAILLYVARVFTPKQDASSIDRIDYYARVIIDSVRCIPPTDAIQKQLLLPIFLAASEVGDDFNRSFVRDYCQHWSNAIHFHQFQTVTALLEEVWMDWDPDTRDTYWWGIKTKQGTGDSANLHEGGWMVQELLLG
ncbi:fungal-specific transcription factor domain-containing protein [Mariannaea sp. PMI_226]|nr:fungal-specific transcription factor domain-containing protein [Mariannaea sp. PMI_226]